MTITMLREFFMWCTIINWGVMLLAFLLCSLAQDWVYRMHSRWFPLPRENFNTVLYAFFGLYKLIVMVFCFIPYLALLIIGR
ncbi:MAG: hypothetical protein HN341_10135 [Verrucomicrobia bacterium]|jgi:hypothetical protein|nr:hypothetical protein [Verrucomicrobiota bacterium]